MPMMKGNEIVIFETADKSISLPVMIENESVWLNRGQIAELFERDIKTIGKHINNALKEEIIRAKCSLSQKFCDKLHLMNCIK